MSAAVKATLIKGIRSRDWTLVRSVLTEEFRGRFPRPDDGRQVDDDLLAIRRYDPTLPELGRDPFLATLREHVDKWVEIERASWHAFEFLLEPGMDRAYVRAHVQFGGTTPGGGRAALDATIAAEVVETAPQQWQFRSLEVLDAQSTESAALVFRDITDATGFHFNASSANRELRQQVIDTRTNMTYWGLSAVDWNRDGFWDLLATESLNRSVLFVNDRRGGFVLEDLPIDAADDNPSLFLFVDLDNDGLEELIGNHVHTYEDEKAWIGIYTRVEGQWVFRPRALEFENPAGLRHTDMQIITAGDVDGNGYLDLFFGGYENSDSRQPGGGFNLVEATDGDDNLLFMNHGNLRLTEESDARGIVGTQYTFVAEFFDFDFDGDLDVFEGNDYGSNVVWDNLGDGTFESLPEHRLTRDPNYTMGVTVADRANTGSWSIYVSNMYSHAGNRVVGLNSG